MAQNSVTYPRKCSHLADDGECTLNALPYSKPPRCIAHLSPANRRRVTQRVSERIERAMGKVEAEAALLLKQLRAEKRRHWKRGYNARCGICRCAQYSFPHRAGGGRCEQREQVSGVTNPSNLAAEKGGEKLEWHIQ